MSYGNPPTGLSAGIFTTPNYIQAHWTNGNCGNDCGLGYHNPAYTEVWENSGSGWSKISDISYPTNNKRKYISYNTTCQYKARHYFVCPGAGNEGFSDYSNVDSVACWKDTESDTCNLTATESDNLVSGGVYSTTVTITATETEGATYSDIDTATVTLTATEAETQTAHTDYKYYLGNSAGKIFEYDEDYKSDNGATVSYVWESKRTDFADQVPEALDRFKTIHSIRLWYVDQTADTPVIVSISRDGGVTWEGKSKTLGTGDGKTKDTIFWFMTSPEAHGEKFSFKISCGSTTHGFCWLGMEVNAELGASYMKL